MQSTGRVAYSSDESTEVKIASLYLDGASGKVVANIDHRMLSLEAKSGHGLDIKINTIKICNASSYLKHTKLRKTCKILMSIPRVIFYCLKLIVNSVCWNKPDKTVIRREM